jgi:hypothetical protein
MRCAPEGIDLVAWGRECRGKVRYPNKHMAIRLARNARSRQRPEEIPIHHYRCRFGDHYHIGHQILERRLALMEGYMQHRVTGEFR